MTATITSPAPRSTPAQPAGPATRCEICDCTPARPAQATLVFPDGERFHLCRNCAADVPTDCPGTLELSLS